MRRVLSERNLVVVLFVSALVIFVLAQQDIKKVEHQLYPAISVLPSPPSQSASAEIKEPVAPLPVKSVK